MVRGEIMNFTAHIGIGILLVLTIIGLLILLRRNSFKSENSKRIYIVTGALQAVHIILYLTGLMEKIAQINVYIAFGICTIVSIICILMISTIIIFLLPDAGMPPLIQFSV